MSTHPFIRTLLCTAPVLAALVAGCGYTSNRFAPSTTYAEPSLSEEAYLKLKRPRAYVVRARKPVTVEGGVVLPEAKAPPRVKGGSILTDPAPMANSTQPKAKPVEQQWKKADAYDLPQTTPERVTPPARHPVDPASPLARPSVSPSSAAKATPDFTQIRPQANVSVSEAKQLPTLADPGKTPLFSRWYLRGIKHLDAKHYREALDDLSEAVRIGPKVPSARLWRGVARANLDDLPGAIEDYTYGLKLKPEHPELYYYRRALARAEQGATAKAMADANRAIAANATFADAYRFRALLHKHQGNTAAARADQATVERLNAKP